MKKSLFRIGLLLILFITNQSFGQTILWTEDFEGTPNWTLSNSTGTNDADPNIWEINDTEGGVTPPGCGVGNNGDNTLHITCQGLTCNLLGATGAAYNAANTSNTRAQYNVPIVTTGQTNLSLNFDWIGIGEAGDDFTTVQYSIDGGTTWIDIQALTGGTTCGGGQGMWANTNIVLPVACENQADLRFGFNWQNSNNSVGSDPSFAVNDLELTTPTTGSPSVTSNFNTDTPLTICEGTTVNFTDVSTASGTTITTWAWSFNGGFPIVGQGPQLFTYNTAGTFTVDLVVSDGTINDTKQITITVIAPANAGVNNTDNVCNNATLDLNTLLSGADAGGTWSETSGTTSGQFTTGAGVLDGNGLTIGNVYTFDYTVISTAPCPNATSTFTITVIDCSAGSVTAGFTLSTPSPICEGTTITFTDASTETGTTITTWAWSFNGGDVTTANTQGPHSITFNTAGTYDIVLTVDNGSGIADTETISITVNANANAGSDNTANLCNNTTLDLNTLLSTGVTGGVWSETGTSSGQFNAGAGGLAGLGLTVGDIFTFDYTITAIAPCTGNDISTMTVTILDCSAGTPPTASFTTPITTICEGDCIHFTDTSSPTDITNWTWNFDGATAPSTTQDPGNVCFNTAGTYDITLTVVNPFGNNTSTITTITVNAAPNVTIATTPSTTVCTGDQVTLTASGATTYVWDNSVVDATAFIPPVGSTTYTVTGTTNGCTNTATATINVADCTPMIAGFKFNDNICVGSCISFTDTTTGSPVSWAWDFGSDANPMTSTDQNPETICFDTPGVYSIQLTVTDAGGASNSTTNSITVFDLPTITAFHDTLIDLGGQAELNSVSPSFGDVLWTPNTYYINCETCAITYAQPQIDTEYFVTITDPNGCTAKDTVNVTVNFIEGIDVPQAFSPNGDGNNDQLVVKGYGISNMLFKVYNRYGQLVFETQDQNNGWDGTFNGTPENPGVFVWTLEYELLNNKKGIQKGNTAIIK